jgi:hypothetical protein
MRVNFQFHEELKTTEDLKLVVTNMHSYYLKNKKRYAKEIVERLKKYKTRTELWNDLPTELGE